MSKKVFYLYLDKTDDGNTFYVGKGLYGRVFDGKPRNNYWVRVAAKHGMNREIVLATKDEKFALDMEMALINQYGTYVADPENNGKWACNLTKGGEGLSGLKFSDEHKEKLAASHRGNKSYLFGIKKENHPKFGKPISEETRSKISKALSGKNGPMYGKLGTAHPNFGKIQPENWKVQHSKDVSGEKNGKAKLNFSLVKEIRAKFATGKYSNAKLGEEYGVSRAAIYKIVNNINWKI
jgi:hypothetical protein